MHITVCTIKILSRRKHGPVAMYLHVTIKGKPLADINNLTMPYIVVIAAVGAYLLQYIQISFDAIEDILQRLYNKDELFAIVGNFNINTLHDSNETKGLK